MQRITHYCNGRCGRKTTKQPFQRKPMAVAGACKYKKKSRTCNVEDRQLKKKIQCIEKAAAQRGDYCSSC
jgi:hypothetical protein